MNHSFEDFGHLLFSHAQIPDLLVRGELEFEPLGDRPEVLENFFPVNNSRKSSGRFQTQKNILENR